MELVEILIPKNEYVYPIGLPNENVPDKLICFFIGRGFLSPQCTAPISNIRFLHNYTGKIGTFSTHTWCHIGSENRQGLYWSLNMLKILLPLLWNMNSFLLTHHYSVCVCIKVKRLSSPQLLSVRSITAAVQTAIVGGYTGDYYGEPIRHLETGSITKT